MNGQPILPRVLSAVTSAVTLAVAAAFVLPHPALAKTRQQIAIELAVKYRPITFFVAKGKPNACGPGCHEWIAADGVIDPDAAKRFKAFLDDLKRRDLPVFFNSSGGSVTQSMLIGIALREQRMTAGVARTYPDECRRTQVSDARCRRLMQSKAELGARFSAEGAQCNSACVYALLGAPIRKVPRGASLGIHTVFTFAKDNDRAAKAATVDQVHGVLRRYAIEMGVDSALIDAAAKVGSNRIHVLTGEELERFGIDTETHTEAQFETRWTPLRESAQRFIIAKSVTRHAGPHDRLTSAIWIGCDLKNGASYVAYRRELPLIRTAAPTLLRASFGDAALVFGMRQVKEDAVEVGYAPARRGVLEKAAAAPAITVTETGLAADGATPSQRETRLSTAGLPQAFVEFRKQCGENNLTGAIGKPVPPAGQSLKAGPH